MQNQNINWSVIQRASSKDITSSPFPHLIIENPLPDDTYRMLTNSFPTCDQISNNHAYLNNHRFDMPAIDVIENNAIARCWREFISFHSSAAFFERLMTIFKPHILQHYPNLQPYIDKEPAPVGLRFRETHENYPFLIDTSISCNTPTTRRSSVRDAHIDRPNKLISGLFYCRPPSDDSRGGNLQILQPRRPHIHFLNDFDIKRRHYTCYREIPYATNVLIMFLGTPYSWHRVTPRDPTMHPRFFINFVLKLNQPLFSHIQYQNRFDNLIGTPSRIRRRLRRKWQFGCS